MQVVCRTSERSLREYQLSVGSSYTVVEVGLNLAAEEQSNRMLYRLAADDAGVAGLYESDLFEVTDARVPPGWLLAGEGESFRLGPARFLRPGFWEEFFDNVAAARLEFDDEVRRIHDELG